MYIFKLLVYSGFFIILGAIVWKKNIIDFIAGYKKEAIHKPNKLAKNIGIIIILFGVEIGILMLLNMNNFTISAAIVGVLAMLHIIAILICYVYDILQLPK